MSEKKGAAPLVTELVGHLVGKRPAEILTLVAGALGLLTAQVLNLEGSAQALILIIAGVPAVVSYAVDRFFHEHSAYGAVRHQDVAEELEYATARTIRKALLGDPTWEDDQLKLERLWRLHPGHEMTPSKPEDKKEEQ